MKKLAICLSLLLACLLLCACSGKETTPYLSAVERQRLESGLIGTMKLSFSEAVTSGELYFEADRKYDIFDLHIWQCDDNVALLSIHTLPKATVVKESAYLSHNPSWETLKDKKYYLQYSIGEYNYSSEEFTIPVGSKDADTLNIYLDTSSGRQLLQAETTLEFANGNEIDGISKTRLYSLTSHPAYLPHYGKYSLSIDVTGDVGDYDLYYRLIDSSGMIIESDRALFIDSPNTTLYFINVSHIAPGDYTLQFLEEK